MQKRIVRFPYRSTLFSILLFLLFFPLILSLSSKVSADDEGNESSVSHGYVDEIKITKSGTNMEVIPDFSFDPAKSKCEVTLAESCTSKLIISFDHVPEGNPYCKIVDADDELVAKKGAEDKISVSKDFSISLVAPLNKLTVGSEPVEWTIIIGNKNEADDTYSDTDTYTLSLSRKPALKTISVTDETGEPYTLNPAFPKSPAEAAYEYVYSISVPDDAETITLTATTQGKNSYDFYLGEEKKDNPKDGINITLSEWANEDESGTIEIPFSFRYEDSNYPTRSDYILRITNLMPSIVTQPQNIKCKQDENIVLSVEASAPVGYSDEDLTYQWVKHTNGASSSYNLIEGATSKEYNVPTDYAGIGYYSCLVTFTANNIEHQIKTDAAQVYVELSHIVEPRIEFVHGHDLTTTIGSSPGTVRFKCIDELNQDPDRSVKVVAESLKLYITTAAGEEGTLVEESPLVVNVGTGSNTTTHDLYAPTQYAPGTYYYYIVAEFAAFDKTSSEQSVIDEIERVYVKSDIIKHTFTGYDDIVGTKLDGSGTPDQPYLIKSYDDLVYIRDELIHEGHNMWGINFKLTTDIDLPSDWIPIGTYIDPTILNSAGKQDGKNGINIYAFMGNLDGDNHTVTVAEGGLPLFKFVSDVTVKNLNIYGKRIESAGLVTDVLINYGPDGDYNTGVPAMITLENVTLKSGSRTKGSGLVNGSGSGANTITLRGCKVEEDV